MKNLWKYHKGLLASLALLVPGSDAALNLLVNSGVDWSALMVAAGSSSPKVWALSGVLAVAPYVIEKARAMNADEKAQMLADLRRMVEEEREKRRESP